MGRLNGKTAIITGAAAGIGAATARAFATEGARLVLTDLDAAAVAALARNIDPSGGRAIGIGHDVRDEAGWAHVFAEAGKAFGRPDILVNNAGIGISGSVLDMTLENWQKQQAINLDGVFLGVKHSIPVMRLNGGGSVINMSSVAGLKGSPNLAGYCATKGGVRLFTKAVAMECANAKDGVRVNSVHPGIIETPIWDSIIGTGEPGSNVGMPRGPVLDAMTAQGVPLAVKGFPADIANGVLWLASDESRYVTGAELVIDGGLSIK